MNITRANTEATVSYKIRRVSFDKQIRIATVAHTLLGRLVEGAHGDRVLGALYGDMADRTRPVARVPGAAIAVREAAQRGVALSVAAAHADFEWACRDLLTDALEFWEPCFKPALGNAKPPPAVVGPLAKRGWAGTVSEALRAQSADEGFLPGCYSLLGIKPGKEDIALLPLFDFFRRCRNRIIHQDGTAGSDLMDFAKSQEVQKSFQSLGARVRRMTPDLPTLKAADPIILSPSHAILFVVVTLTLFTALASRIRSLLDKDGYLRMTAHYAYGSSHHPFRQEFYKDVLYPALSFLRERYGVRGLNKQDIIIQFRRLGLWDVMVARFHEFASAQQTKATPR
jgi:hypothetical protein